MAKEDDDKAQRSAKKEEVKKIIKATTEDAKRIVEQTKGVTIVFSRVAEFGEIVGPLVDDVVSEEDVEKHHGFWTGLQKTTSEVAGKIQLLVSDTGYPSTASGTVYAYTNTIETQVSIIDISTSPPEVVAAVGEFNQFIHNPELADDVRQLLLGLGMDKARKGKENPLELFNVAFAAYERNAPAVQALIPVRSSINECILILLTQRPGRNRGKTTGWEAKIRSVCNRLAYSTVLPFTVNQLVHDMDDLIDYLSVAKTDELERTEVRDRIYKAVRFYHALLESIDPSKLRMPPN